MKHRRGVLFGLCLLLAAGWGQARDIRTLHDEAGFIRIDPVRFFFHLGSYLGRFELASSQAFLWYSFQVADENPGGKPLFVFFNGGPGSGTSCGLLSFNTGRMTLDTSFEGSEVRLVANPQSWTTLGNLLYIDARQTGFSYCTMSQPEVEAKRILEFNAQNFNVFIDAADFIRLLLAFWAKHPELEENRVVFVPESYGGTRVTAILHMLLFYQGYGNMACPYQDPSLVNALQEHYERVFPEYRGRTVPPEVIARQFSHQVMIQPAIALGNQFLAAGELFEREGSIIYQLAAEDQKVYLPCSQQPGNPNCQPFDNALNFIEETLDRDVYFYAKPRYYTNNAFSKAARMLQFVSNLGTITNSDPHAVPEMYALARSQAYRFRSLQDYQADLSLPFVSLYVTKEQIESETLQSLGSEGDLDAVFGPLQPWDRYHLELNGMANYAFYYNIGFFHGYPTTPYYSYLGDMFLQNLLYVNTFITDAKNDLVVYTPAIPYMFQKYYSHALESVTHDTQEPGGAERPGRLVFSYKLGNLVSMPTTRAVRLPPYFQSGHAVTLSQPGDFLADVKAWLQESSPNSESGDRPR